MLHMYRRGNRSSSGSAAEPERISNARVRIRSRACVAHCMWRPSGDRFGEECCLRGYPEASRARCSASTGHGLTTSVRKGALHLWDMYVHTVLGPEDALQKRACRDQSIHMRRDVDDD